ncbi:MAG: hypothetical protein NC131_01370 [Roseburia sp.]|nr:hypothetical protein [Roseburia sp.]
MKTKKTPLIICICLTVAFAIASVLCFVIPIFTQKKDSPVEVSQTIKLEHKTVDGFRAYYLVGKIKNKTERTVTFKDDGGLKVYFSGSNDVANDWLDGTPNITLQPDEEFDLSVGTYYFVSSGVSVSKVTIDVGGTTYYLVGRQGGGIASILGFVFIILTITMIIVTVSIARQRKTGNNREVALSAVCSQLGDGSTVIRGSLSDKNESKKAAAKTAGWVLGGALAAIFTGVGVYRVYSGTSLSEFIINKNRLYMLKDGGTTTDSLINITPAEFAVESITVKKNKVIMKCADNKRSITLFADKKSDMTAERIAGYLNDIFVNNAGLTVGESVPTGDPIAPADPFTDLQPEAEAENDGASVEVKEISGGDIGGNDGSENG